jgi:hypothetical protein
MDASRNRKELAAPPCFANCLGAGDRGLVVVGAVHHQHRHVYRLGLSSELPPEQQEAIGTDLGRKRRSSIFGDQYHVLTEVESPGAADVSDCGTDVVCVAVVDRKPRVAGVFEHGEELSHVRRLVAGATVDQDGEWPRCTVWCVGVERHAAAILDVAERTGGHVVAVRVAGSGWAGV